MVDHYKYAYGWLTVMKTEIFSEELMIDHFKYANYRLLVMKPVARKHSFENDNTRTDGRSLGPQICI